MRASRLLALAAAIAVAGGACGGDGDGGGGPSNQDPVADFTFECTLLDCTFTDASTDADGTVTSWSWNFDDGSDAVTTEDATHSYTAANTYDVTLTVTDDDGADASVTKQVVVSTDPPANQPPTAAFTVNCSSLDCSFNANSSADADGSIVAYSWAFSDGATATGATTTHSFAATSLSNASATLTVTDDDGATDTFNQAFTVAPPAICEGVTCDLTLQDDATITVTLTNENCNAAGNTLRILTPVDVTLFTNGCSTPIGTSYELGGAGNVFPAGTKITPEVISGSDELEFTPTLRIRAGTGYPTWVLEFDDGEGCGGNPGCVEPDFDDLEITITATP